MHAIQQLSEDLLGALVALGAHLGENRAALGDDVDRRPARDRADVGGRVRIDPAEAHVGDGARSCEDRAATLLGPHAGVGGDAAEGRLQAVVGRRGKHQLADRGGMVEDVAEAAA